MVPFAQYDYRGHQDEAREHVRRIHNAFWLCHAAFGSKARKVHGTVYEVPDEVGPVDVTTFGCVLLHLRDPFAALASALRLTRETVVVTEPVQLRRWPALLLRLSGCAAPVFLPDARTAAPKDTWWALTPRVVRRFLAVLGFEEARVRYHRQRFAGRPHPMFTVVGRRTRPLPPSPPAGEGEK